MSRPTVAIVVHVFGDFYRSLLWEQLRSITSHSWKVTVDVYVAYEQGDRATLALLHKYAATSWRSVHVCGYHAQRPQLLNRNIIRNEIAKKCTADWVWFTDCDYMFGEGSLDAVGQLDPDASPLYYPRIVHKSTSFWDVHETQLGFQPVKILRAIGGLQIVPGHIARKGYLDGIDRYQKPATSDRFLDTRGDHAYRRSLGTPGMPADIPNVYRLRHRIPKTSARHHLLPMG